VRIAAHLASETAIGVKRLEKSESAKVSISPPDSRRPQKSFNSAAPFLFFNRPASDRGRCGKASEVVDSKPPAMM
jgi:hypothetical protein